MADEIVNFNDKNNTRSKRKKRKKRAHPWAFPLGLIIAVLTVIGFMTVLLAGIGGVKNAVLKLKNIDEYNTLLTPVVMNDPSMFDDISKADSAQLIDISIWSILKSNLSPDKYTYQEGNMIIPEADVTAEYTRLFGTDREPVHQTVAGYGYEFEYNSTDKTYLIPLTGITPTYTPDVVEVNKKSNTVVLTVALLSADGWAQGSDGKMVAPEPDKYIKVTLRETDNGYYISAMQSTSAPETATTQISQQTTAAETTTEAPQTETQATANENTEAQAAESAQ